MKSIKIWDDEENELFADLMQHGFTMTRIQPYFPGVTLRQIEHQSFKIAAMFKVNRPTPMKGRNSRKPEPKPKREKKVRISKYELEGRMDFTWMNIETGGM